MRNGFLRRLCLAWCAAALLFCAAPRGRTAETLTWDTEGNKVSADLKSVELLRFLEGVAKLTGWQVYLEADTSKTISAKFKDLPPGDALRLALGDLNFALVPDTNARPRLFVFRTSRERATQLVRPADLDGAAAGARAISNELVVTLKPGANIDEIARRYGARVTGRIDALNTYRLQFDSAEAALAARRALANEPDVASIDSNYPVEKIRPAQSAMPGAPTPDLTLKPQENKGDCSVVVGLIDTGFASLGSELDKFMLPTISVVGSGSGSGDQLTHGGAMARTILSTLQATGGANGSAVRILPVDVYGGNQLSSTFDVAHGISRAVNAGANIINLSLGSQGDSAVLRNLITEASSRGVVFFAAAGNMPVTTPTYPAAYSEVIAVTAGRSGEVAEYANRGDFVDIMAPGTSLVPFKGETFAITGTSTATAYASGIAAGIADSSKTCPSQVVPTIRQQMGVSLSR